MGVKLVFCSGGGVGEVVGGGGVRGGVKGLREVVDLNGVSSVLYTGIYTVVYTLYTV